MEGNFCGAKYSQIDIIKKFAGEIFVDCTPLI